MAGQGIFMLVTYTKPHYNTQTPEQAKSPLNNLIVSQKWGRQDQIHVSNKYSDMVHAGTKVCFGKPNDQNEISTNELQQADYILVEDKTGLLKPVLFKEGIDASFISYSKTTNQYIFLVKINGMHGLVPVTASQLDKPIVTGDTVVHAFNKNNQQKEHFTKITARGMKEMTHHDKAASTISQAWFIPERVKLNSEQNDIQAFIEQADTGEQNRANYRVWFVDCEAFNVQIYNLANARDWFT
jgi:hypothetical protein